MTVPDLPTFLTQRYDEQEAVARAAIDPKRPGTHWQWEAPDGEEDPEAPCWLRTAEEFPTTSGVGPLPAFPLGFEFQAEPARAMPHIATHDPAYVLADLAAKREIVAEAVFWRDKRPHSPNAESFARWLLMRLAQPFADHPDFRPEWKL